MKHTRNTMIRGGRRTVTGMLYRLSTGLLYISAIFAKGQSPQQNAGNESGTLQYQKANMRLCPEGKWTLGEDNWLKIVRVNMLEITAADWAQVPGVKKAWPMTGFEGAEGMAFRPVITEVKDVDRDGKPDIFRCRSEHPGARIERLRYAISFLPSPYNRMIRPRGRPKRAADHLGAEYS